MEGLFGCSSDVASVGDIELVGVKAHTRQQERHVFGKQAKVYGIWDSIYSKTTVLHKFAQVRAKSTEIRGNWRPNQ